MTDQLLDITERLEKIIAVIVITTGSVLHTHALCIDCHRHY